MCVYVGGGFCSASDCNEVERCDDAMSISLTVYFHLSLIVCVCVCVLGSKCQFLIHWEMISVPGNNWISSSLECLIAPRPA